MKKIINKIAFILAVSITFVSCNEPDNPIYDVRSGVKYGAILRTLDDGANRNFSISDLNSTFIVEFEEQDEQYGDLLDKVDVYISFSDNTPGGADNSKPEVLFTSFPASSFTTSANGLPKNTLTAAFGDVLSSLGLVPGQYDGGDSFTVRLDLILTDGRSFSAADTSGSLQGSYFRSPYAYKALIVCPPVAGDYRVEMHDDWGDGWQTTNSSGGDGIKVYADGVLIAEVGMCSPYGGAAGSFLEAGVGGCTIPPGANPGSDWTDATATVTMPVGVSDAEWIFPGDSWGEISFEVYGPNSGAIIFAGAIGATPAGPIALNYCGE